MAHTERDELDRVPSFDEQLRRQEREREAARRAESEVRRCDACGEALTDAERLRYRHEHCPPPTLPPVAADLLARLRARREQQEAQP